MAEQESKPVQVWTLEVTYPHIGSRLVYCRSKGSAEDKVRQIDRGYAVWDDITGSVFWFPAEPSPVIVLYAGDPPEDYQLTTKWEPTDGR